MSPRRCIHEHREVTEGFWTGIRSFRFTCQCPDTEPRPSGKPFAYALNARRC